MPRTGRPPKENPKNTRIQVRLDKDTIDKLDKCVERYGTTRSDVVRKGIDMIFQGKKE